MHDRLLVQQTSVPVEEMGVLGGCGGGFYAFIHVHILDM